MATNIDELEIVLTDGAIRNGYLRLPPGSEKHFTGNGNEGVSLEVDGIGSVDGAYDANRKMFRWRGWKKFFKLHQLRAGDRVLVRMQGAASIHVAPYHDDLLSKLRSSPPRNPTPSGTSKARVASRRTNLTQKRCNELDGATWLQLSLSVWSDVRKSPDEARLKHPAMFPCMLADRLIRAFMRRQDQVVLDPFAGSGSTLVAAREAGKSAIGFELSPAYVALAERRLKEPGLKAHGSVDLRQGDATKLLESLPENCVDLCITSPPYWDILNQARSADGKETRHYGNLPGDLGTISSYDEFLVNLGEVFEQIFRVLRPGAYCCVIVMDIRKQNRFYAFHSDLAQVLQRVGYELDDVIIWNRGHEYNNLRPLGYPYRFRINKIHEYILIFRKQC